MVKTALYIAGFYLVYFLFLSSDTNYLRNRVFLLSSALLSFMLPLVTLGISEQSGIFYLGKNLSEIFVIGDKPGSGNIVDGYGLSGIMTIILKIYFSGVLLFTLKLLFDIVSLAFLIIRHREKDNNIIRFSGFNTAGFSAIGYIFINQSVLPEEEKEIILHERNHLKHLHFFDIVLVEIIKIFQWFNPVIYLFNRSLRAIHEYQADEGCIKSGMTLTGYQNLLITHLMKSKIFVTSNSFSNPSLIRKRMVMMSKSKSGYGSSLKLLLVVPVILLIILFISACEAGQDSIKSSEAMTKVKISPVVKEMPSSELNDKVMVVAEEMPQYPGGDKALIEFIFNNVKYPEAAKEKNIQGKVILRFAVMADGHVDKITIIRGVDPDLDKEAIRVINLMEQWKPGRQDGKPVNVWYSVPITFKLQ